MRITRKITAIAAAAGLAGLGFVGVSGVANAATPPVQGNIVIPQTLTLSLVNMTSFTLQPSNSYVDNGSEYPGGMAVVIGSNDGSGYVVDETGPADFADGSGSIPTNYVDTDAPNATGGATPNYIPLTTGSQSVIQGATVSGTTNPGANMGGTYAGDDAVPFNGWRLDPGHNPLPANTPAGTFTGNVTFSLLGN